MRIYYDTEFIEDGKTIDLLSIGMVAEDGRELYLIPGDTNAILRACQREWLRQNVLPYLPIIVRDDGEEFGMSEPYWYEWNEDHPAYDKNVWITSTIRAMVHQFILNTPNPQLWSWYPAYDHVVLAQLFGTMMDLPPVIPMTTFDLEQERVRIGAPLPLGTKDAHNALADAHWHRDIGSYLQRYELSLSEMFKP